MAIGVFAEIFSVFIILLRCFNSDGGKRNYGKHCVFLVLVVAYIQLITVESAYQLCTKAYVAEYVKKALELRKAPPLSKASLEVLAIIAYNQPVTRSFIEMVRGVDSDSIVSSLVDKGLVAERGTLDAPGRPVLFGTTDAFLRCFGLESIDDLPKTELQMSGEQVAIDFTAEEPAENTEAE